MIWPLFSGLGFVTRIHKFPGRWQNMLPVAVIFCNLNIKFWSEFTMSSPYCLCKQYKTSLLRDDYWSLLVTVQTLQGLSCWEINKLHKSIPDDTFFIKIQPVFEMVYSCIYLF